MGRGADELAETDHEQEEQPHHEHPEDHVCAVAGCVEDHGGIVPRREPEGRATSGSGVEPGSVPGESGRHLVARRVAAEQANRIDPCVAFTGLPLGAKSRAA